MADFQQIVITSMVVILVGLAGVTMYGQAVAFSGSTTAPDFPMSASLNKSYNSMNKFQSDLANSTQSASTGSLQTNDGTNIVVISQTAVNTLKLIFDILSSMIDIIMTGGIALGVAGIQIPFWMIGIAISYIAFRVGSALLQAMLKWWI